MELENAYIIGYQAVSYIIRTESLLTRFINLTGISEDTIRENFQNKDFLSSCIDFLLCSETDLTDFCTDANINPEMPMQAFLKLGGNPVANSL